MKRFLPFVIAALIAMAWIVHVTVAQTGLSSPVLTNFNKRHFIITPNGLPTNVILLNLDSGQFDTNATVITVTNVFGPGVTNIFETFITTNIYVTNIFVTQIIVSNIVAGNVHGTTNTLAMFTPDEFSVGDSIVTQNSDTNGVTVNGAGEAYIVFGPGTTNVVKREAGALLYTNANTLVSFQVVNSAGNKATLEVDGGGHTELLAEAAHNVVLSVGGANSATWTGSIFEASGVTQLGAPGVLWDNSYFGTGYFYGFDSGPNYSLLKVSHTGTNGQVIFDSQSGGSAGIPRPFVFTNAIVEIHKNIGAQLTVGDTTFVDMSRASQTNAVAGAIAFAHATNGVDLLDLTHVRWLLNGSGSDQTLTIPAAWRTNVFSAVPPALTNNTITKMILNCGGDTSTAAKQTNVYVSFEYYK